MSKVREWTDRRSKSEQRRIARRARRGKPSAIKPLILVRDEARFGNRFPVKKGDKK